MMRPCLRRLIQALLAATVVAVAAPAGADETTGACVPIAIAVCPSISIGEFVPNPVGPSGGMVISASVPHIPIGYIPQIAIAVPFRGPGRFAATGELRTPGNLYAGAGAGIGNLDGAGGSGFTFDLLGGLRLARNVSLVGRYYFGFKTGGGTSGFVGLRFGF
jgi:hypothetical protein